MLTEEEISNKEINHDNFDVNNESIRVKNAFRQIMKCIETDGDYLSDGEVIDMIHSYLQKINVEL